MVYDRNMSRSIICQIWRKKITHANEAEIFRLYEHKHGRRENQFFPPYKMYAIKKKTSRDMETRQEIA